MTPKRSHEPHQVKALAYALLLPLTLMLARLLAFLITATLTTLTFAEPFSGPGAETCNELIAPTSIGTRFARVLEVVRESFAHPFEPQNTSTTPLIDPVELTAFLNSPGVYGSLQNGSHFSRALALTLASRQARGIDVSLDLPSVANANLFRDEYVRQRKLRFPNTTRARREAIEHSEVLNTWFASLTPENNPFPARTIELRNPIVALSGGSRTEVYRSTIDRSVYLSLFGRTTWTHRRSRTPSIVIRYLHPIRSHIDVPLRQENAARRTLAAGILHEYLRTEAAPRSRWVIILEATGERRLAVVTELIRGLSPDLVQRAQSIESSPAGALGEFFLGNPDNSISNYTFGQNAQLESQLMFFDHDLAFPPEVLSPALAQIVPFGRILPDRTLWPTPVIVQIQTLNETHLSNLVGGLLNPSELQGLYLRGELLQNYLRITE